MPSRNLLPGEREVIVRREDFAERPGYTVYVPAFRVDDDTQGEPKWMLSPAFEAGGQIIRVCAEDLSVHAELRHHTKAEAVAEAQRLLNEADQYAEDAARS